MALRSHSTAASLRSRTAKAGCEVRPVFDDIWTVGWEVVSAYGEPIRCQERRFRGLINASRRTSEKLNPSDGR